MSALVLTVGHSTHPLAIFLALLQRHGVTAVADVRSAPYSRFNPQFNRETLAEALEEHDVRYVFLGRELGARSKAPTCYEDGRLQYARLARTALFCSGIDRVIQCARDFRVALMCAEKDPIDCHRTILIGRELVDRGADIMHILEDGRLEPHDETMQRLLARLGIAGPHLFFSPAELIEQAYAAQAARIAVRGLGTRPYGTRNPAMRLMTIGFTKKSARDFFEALQAAGVKRVVDVRLNNVSQLAGFAKKKDLAYFLERICGIDYVHLPVLAPTQAMLDAFKKNGGAWQEYEDQFLHLMAQRNIETAVALELLEDGCLLCSEDRPHHCHRRLVAEYLHRHWGDVTIEHL